MLSKSKSRYGIYKSQSGTAVQSSHTAEFCDFSGISLLFMSNES